MATKKRSKRGIEKRSKKSKISNRKSKVSGNKRIIVASVGINNEESKIMRESLSKEKYLLKNYETPLNKKILSEIKNADVITTHVYSKIDEKVMNEMKNLKLIATRTTGYDHIDLKSAKERGIIVTNVPSYGENTVAEHTFALMLNLSRKVHKSYLRTINNNYNAKDLEGFDLKGKTLGVIGAGHIGLHVIKIAKGFGMKVLAYDKHENRFLSELLHFEYAPMKKILKEADIITLHVPYNKHTHHLIDEKAINKMKKGVIIINTSRGGVIKTEALCKGLTSGKVGGAGLDVIEGEEALFDNEHESPEKIKGRNWHLLSKELKMFKMDNVIFTPHNAFNSREATERRIKTAADNIRSFFEKKKITNEVIDY